MSDDLKSMLEELSRVLGETVQESDKVRQLMKRIEKAGLNAGVVLSVTVGAKGKGTEVRQIVFGTGKSQEAKSSSRRISAFDRRFLRALRIKLND